MKIQNKKSVMAFALAMAVSVCALATAANAATINVPNFSFESGLTSWSTTGVAGNQTGGGIVPNATDGTQVLFLNGGSTAKQDLLSLTSPGSTIAGDTAYTLSVDVGETVVDPWPLSSFSISLYDVSTGLTLSNTNGTALLATTLTQKGVLSTYSVTYTSLASDPSFGDQIGIKLADTGGTSVQTIFDNVRLDATAVPEPGTVSALLMGLSGLAGVRFFRRKSVV